MINPFASQPQQYRAFRPQYPNELFDYLASLTSEHKLAWDCATGNGQVAIGLAQRFDRIVATDMSDEQLREALRHRNIDYRTEAAEASSLSSASADLITVAQGVHWFDRKRFYPEVERVLKPDGVIAVWTYWSFHYPGEINGVIRECLSGRSREARPGGLQLVADGYKSLDFPFDEIKPPELELSKSFTLDQLVGYITTWTAYRSLPEDQQTGVKAQLLAGLARVWGEAETIEVRTPLHLRVGRVQR